ncbi:MAG: hypothetical protein AAB407_02995 [Patescibacteria group bacterium]
MIFKNILIIALVIVALLGAGYYLYTTQDVGQVACTMEARECPDGSFVGRGGPKCEFAACPNEGMGGIRGIVLLGPICPVVQNPPAAECADKPYSTRLAVTAPNSSQVIREVESDINGNFSVALAPGNYVVASAIAANVLPYCAASEVITVQAGIYKNVTIFCDTGIR